MRNRSKYVGYRAAEERNNDIAVLHVLRSKPYAVAATDEHATIAYDAGYAS